MIHKTSSTINDDGTITYRIEDFVNAHVAAVMAGGPVLSSKVTAFGEQLLIDLTIGIGDKNAVPQLAGGHDTIPRASGVPLFQPDPQVVDSARRNPSEQHPSSFGLGTGPTGPQPLGKAAPPPPPEPLSK